MDREDGSGWENVAGADPWGNGSVPRFQFILGGKEVPLQQPQPRMLMSQGREQSLIVCHTELGTGCRAQRDALIN